jgi:hypothetical protein
MNLGAPILFLFLFNTPAQTPKFNQPALPPTEVERGVCALVRKLDAAEALKSLAPNAHWETEHEADRCKHRSEGGEVAVRVEHWDTALDAGREFAALKGAFPEAKARELEGLSGPALWLEIPDAGTEVFIIPDTHHYVMVSVLGWGQPREVSKIAEQLARTAMEHWTAEQQGQN